MLILENTGLSGHWEILKDTIWKLPYNSLTPALVGSNPAGPVLRTLGIISFQVFFNF